MSEERFVVLVVRYREKHESVINELVRQIEETLAENKGEVRLAYHGSDKHIVSALEKVLKLTE